MAETDYPSPFNMTPATAMTANLLVKCTADTTATLCGAGEGSVMIGVVDSDVDATMFAAGEKVAIRDRKATGLVELVSAGDIAAAANLYCAAAGTVDDAVTGAIIGVNAGPAIVGAGKVVKAFLFGGSPV